MSQFTHLFQPIKIGSLELKNRTVLLAILPLYGKDDKPTQRLTDFYIARAKGGVGLIIASIFYPVDSGQQGGVGIYDDRFIPGLRDMTKAIHDNGGKVAAQLCVQYHWRKDPTQPAEIVAPSVVTTRPGMTPRELTIHEVRYLVGQFGDAARRAREAGFDAVELHAGIGYLINRFLSPASNRRTDEYGGSPENRARFLMEIIADARSKAGGDYPLLCRISAEEFIKGGNTLADTLKLAPKIEKAGVHALDVQVGWHESTVPLVHASVPQGAYANVAGAVRDSVKVPVIAAYRITDPQVAEGILAQGKADMIGMARALIADPEWPNKVREGRIEDICACIACLRCLDLIMQDKPMDCSVNAQAGREAELALKKATKPKKVLVVGGGPAGMEAARAAALRGHTVVLYERAGALGGHLIEASAAPYKAEIGQFNDYLRTQVEKTGITVRLNLPATVDAILREKPDAVVIAAGSRAIIPDIPGADGPNVSTAVDVLLGKRTVGQNVVVVGGGMIGCETAEYLAKQGKKVALVEMQERLGADIERTVRWVVLQRLRQAGVEMITRAQVEEITPQGVTVHREDRAKSIKGDSVVLAIGLCPNDDLANALKGRLRDLYTVGDCVEPRRIAQAMSEALAAACRI